jgi:hypothetical protein
MRRALDRSHARAWALVIVGALVVVTGLIRCWAMQTRR